MVAGKDSNIFSNSVLVMLSLPPTLEMLLLILRFVRNFPFLSCYIFCVRFIFHFACIETRSRAKKSQEAYKMCPRARIDAIFAPNSAMRRKFWTISFLNLLLDPRLSLYYIIIEIEFVYLFSDSINGEVHRFAGIGQTTTRKGLPQTQHNRTRGTSFGSTTPPSPPPND